MAVVAHFSPATGGRQMVVDAIIIALITGPSNEMLDHGLHSAACSRSSSAAHPAATSIVETMFNIFFLHGPFTPLRTWQTHGTRGPEYKVIDPFLSFHLTVPLDMFFSILF